MISIIRERAQRRACRTPAPLLEKSGGHYQKGNVAAAQMPSLCRPRSQEQIKETMRERERERDERLLAQTHTIVPEVLVCVCYYCHYSLLAEERAAALKNESKEII